MSYRKNGSNDGRRIKVYARGLNWSSRIIDCRRENVLRSFELKMIVFFFFILFDEKRHSGAIEPHMRRIYSEYEVDRFGERLTKIRLLQCHVFVVDLRVWKIYVPTIFQHIVTKNDRMSPLLFSYVLARTRNDARACDRTS